MSHSYSRGHNAEVHASEQTSISAELAHMSFEELQKLKETLGSKVYNEAMFGRKRAGKVDFKRANKNRPREVSSKIPVKNFQNVVTVKKRVIRDPRFDSLCGTYNERSFKKSYSFINEIKSQEKEILKSELANERNPRTQKKIKLLIQRIENQEREENRRRMKLEAEYEDRREKLELLQRGQKPYFKSKREKKVENLVNKFTELKDSAKLVKHIEKQRKKMKKKERRNDFL